MCSITLRIVDRAVLSLLKSWLQAPVQSEGPQGLGMSGGKKARTGTPQGGVISPLLANRYMNRYLWYWKQCAGERQFAARLVNYADDFVILSRGKANEALAWTRQAMTKLKLEINETKTCVRNARQEQFDFLGYSFGLHYVKRTGKPYLGASASSKSVKRIKARGQRNTAPTVRAVGRSARQTQSNAGGVGGLLPPRQQAQELSGRECPCAHGSEELLAKAPQSALAGHSSVQPHDDLHRSAGARNGRGKMRRATDSDAMNQVGEPDAGNPHVRFDERRLEPEPRLPRQCSTLLILWSLVRSQHGPPNIFFIENGLRLWIPAIVAQTRGYCRKFTASANCRNLRHACRTR